MTTENINTEAIKANVNRLETQESALREIDIMACDIAQTASGLHALLDQTFQMTEINDIHNQILIAQKIASTIGLSADIASAKLTDVRPDYQPHGGVLGTTAQDWKLVW